MRGLQSRRAARERHEHNASLVNWVARAIDRTVDRISPGRYENFDGIEGLPVFEVSEQPRGCMYTVTVWRTNDGTVAGVLVYANYDVVKQRFICE